MSDWTPDLLKEHYDTVNNLHAKLEDERQLRYQQRFEAGEKRLDGMNEFRSALSDAQKTFVTWPMVIALVSVGCLLTGTVVGLVTFFMRK
jgi:membrane protein required for beta-lactamase induction